MKSTKLNGKMDTIIQATPWDSKVFGFNTYEIHLNSETLIFETIKEIIAKNQSGHYTLKVNSLGNKKVLFDYGFYYCDTLIEPYCNKEKLINYEHNNIYISQENSLNELISICDGAFRHGRFHRDFNIEKKQADCRYNSWLAQLFEEKKVWGLMYNQDLAGFWAFSENKILLHALSPNYQGKGMAKYFWSLACQEMFKFGYTEIISSISASNIPALNLYVSLGFKFKNPQDIYHLIID